MTPSEILREAARLIEEYLDALPPLPLEVSAPNDDEEGAGEELYIIDATAIRRVALDDDPGGNGLADWFVLSPTLLRMVGEYLQDLAADAEEMPADMRAVVIAEVVIAALSPQAPVD